MFPKQPPAAVSSVTPVCILYMSGQEKDRRLFRAISHLFLKETETTFSGTILDLFLGVYFALCPGIGCTLTLSLHPHLKAFSQPTELAAIAVVFVDDAVLLTAAAVSQILPHTPLKKALTSFATDGTIVTSWTQTKKFLFCTRG